MCIKIRTSSNSTKAVTIMNKLLKSRTDIYNIQAKRGKIIDYNGKVLADSVQTYNVGVNQRLIREYKHYEEIKNPKTGKTKLKLVGQCTRRSRTSTK